MNKMLTVLLVLGTALSITFAQTVIFSEDFESGDPSSDWELYRVGEESLQAVDMTSAPATLEGGGNYVGYLQDSDGSYSGAALALAGDVTLQNYRIEADVYCYVNHSSGSAYTGVAVYGDSSHQGSASYGFYYKLVADFDGDNRFRLYNNQLSGFAYTFHAAIDASGLYSGSGWHKMAIEVETMSSGTAFTCYFDGEAIGAGTYMDDGADQYGNGKFGLFSFQMDGDGIAGYFDNIVVTSLTAVSIDSDIESTMPSKFNLAQNYPNPFNSSTTITFQVDESANTSLDIYTVNGEFLRNLMVGYLEPRSYSVTWDGKDRFGRDVPTGVYVYTLLNGTQQLSKKLVLLK